VWTESWLYPTNHEELQRIIGDEPHEFFYEKPASGIF